jgi:phage gpG-like protein
MASLDSPAFRRELSQTLSASAFKLTMDTFKTSTDPYGNAWAPLVSRKGQPLLKTGRLRASTFFNPLDSGFRIDFAVPYAAHHQYGTRPSTRAALVAKQDAKGRFVRRAKAGTLVRIRGHFNIGIPRRQMVPMPETGGLPPKWVEAFNRDTDALVLRKLGKAAR